MSKVLRAVANKRNLFVEFDDGNAVLTPWGITKKLAHASDLERAAFELIGRGEGIHWPLLGEDVLVSELASRE